MPIRSINATDIEVKRSRVLLASIPLSWDVLNTLTQIRQEIHRIDTDELAEGILAQGQMVAGRVVALTPTEAKKYVQEINVLFSTKHRLKSLKQIEIDGEPFYLILVYGHRRLAACKRALQLMEKDHRTSDYFRGEYLCEIYFGLTLHDIIPIQFTENQHVQVPKHQEAAAMWRFWRYLNRHNGGITIAEFAKKIGKKTDWVRDMLRFTSLPPQVQELVTSGATTVSLLLHVARLVEAHATVGTPLSEAEVVAMVRYLIAKRVKTADFAKEVTERIANLIGGQADFFTSEPISARVIRRTAAIGLVNAIISQLQYLRIINEMTKTGAFGSLSPYVVNGDPTDRGQYSPHSPARMALKMAGELRRLVPDLAHMIKQDGKSRRALDLALHDIGISYAVFAAVVEDEEST